MNVNKIQELIREACGTMACDYKPDILNALKTANESDEKSKIAIQMLLDNARIAKEERIPICQDTGMITAYVHVGQEVHFTGGSLKDAIQKGVAEGYSKYYLRASVVDDPVFDRKNTKNNTPAAIYMDIVEGDEVIVELTAKGFGSENMSRLKMCKPAEGIEGVKNFVLETIQMAGPNACPPMIVGVGVGGTFDYSAYLSKRALLRGLDEYNEDARYASLEKELTEKANKLMIGPMGLHGNTTALKVNVEYYPTHIAGMPVAVNICCHACRHERLVF